MDIDSDMYTIACTGMSMNGNVYTASNHERFQNTHTQYQNYGLWENEL